MMERNDEWIHIGEHSDGLNMFQHYYILILDRAMVEDAKSMQPRLNGFMGSISLY
jgi:hypothetical protein